MERGFLISLAIAIPVILFPVAMGWYLNIGQIIDAVRESLAKRTHRRNSGKTMPEAGKYK